MEIVVVDVDGTLVLEGSASRFFFRLASFFQALGRRRQHPNRQLMARLAGYEKVVVLTGRDVKDASFTADQLKRAGLSFDQIICAPRRDILTKWKLDVVGKMRPSDGLVWVDDIFVESSLKQTALSSGVKACTSEDLGGNSSEMDESTFDAL